MSTQQIPICTAGKHNFKDLRTRTKKSKDSWHFFLRCSHCPAMLHNIVTEKFDDKGEISVSYKNTVITSSGLVIPIETTVRPAQVAEQA